ncbi:bacteriophage abortive infection AbiH family protein [Mucilaginibacter sp. X5P1]|uniref:bacteriophage abortive infection AbiH family protein n=1 Tax=Mucilaginibacter sp. X5P1 TaxID=2723088 RepID=UPI00160F9F88|nr:bacteriophage abortive infection AbiH family protein [Mucilaginibacter sp. X5P1]MBB6141725.1 hypothetical protein [Mucilaginibacter sp. X5P1]
MKKLYIIGNGFDIYHGMKTTYADFHQYLSQYNVDLEIKLENYFNFKTDPNYLWTDFENDLSSFDYRSLFNDSNNIDVLSDSFKLSECYGLEDDINEQTEELIQNIKDDFHSWIEGIEYPLSGNTNTIYFDPDAIFLNFNYTDTLEELYNIPKNNILYIHNNANDLSGELIFGHSQNAESDPEMDEFDAEGNSNRTMFTDSENASRTPFYAFQKNTTEIIDQHRQFFESLGSITQILVLGHSLGKVDWPYFIAVAKNIPQANWLISYHSEFERESKRQFANEMFSLKKVNIEMIQIGDLRL